MPPASHDDDARIREAVEYAEKYAGDDDAGYIEAINRFYREKAGAGAERARALPVVAAEMPAKSIQIYKDPRYLANARALARRTLGGDRVIGGKVVPEGDFLDCVAVGNDTVWGCSGTLIAPNLVLTAGHCVDYATRVYFGNDVNQAGKVVNVKEGIQHPEYLHGKNNDLTALLLEETVTTVAPRKLASKKLIDNATDGRVVGFGAVDPGGFFGYGVKRFVDVPIASNNCRGSALGHDDSLSYGCDPGLEIVAGRPLLERDGCKGDSGGPFYIIDEQGQWLLAGATSRSTKSAMHTCGDGGIYPRMDRYRAWIASIPGVELP
jgi:secreted trypsin-like serine protease